METLVSPRGSGDNCLRQHIAADGALATEGAIERARERGVVGGGGVRWPFERKMNVEAKGKQTAE